MSRGHIVIMKNPFAITALTEYNFWNVQSSKVKISVIDNKDAAVGFFNNEYILIKKKTRKFSKI